MKTSIELLLNILDVVKVSGKLPANVMGISQDSRRIQPGYIFAARTGGKVRGSSFVTDAANAGAVMILLDESDNSNYDLPTVVVRNFREALTSASHLLYGYPSKRLTLIGITGTDGKTSTAHIIKSILISAGYKCGMLGTIGYDTITDWREANLTTPDIDEICELLDEMTASSLSSETIWAVMEVSSHALELGRVDGLKFSAVGITNLNSEHMDFHETIENYANAKSKLFGMLNENSPGVINISANESDIMLAACSGKVVTYGQADSDADYRVNTLSHSLNGGNYRIDGLAEQFEVETELIGEYQGENITLAAAILLKLGIESKQIVKGVKALRSVPGRMERVDCGQPFTVMVDYAHTSQALENSLNTIKPLCAEKLISLFGCGGDRDTTKRPEMGRVVAETADVMIVTNDNPRTEDPMQIMDDILTGITPELLPKVLVEPDRELAIKLAVKIAKKDDVVVISGKGAETYQLVGTTKNPFDDRDVARTALNQAGWSI